MEQNYQRNSRKRLNSLILLVAFTAIMLIVSTYAWFTAQQNVSITNLTGIVNVVDGLLISLDAENWSDTLDLSVLDIVTDAYGSNTNFKPTELLPVSTTGVAGVDATELKMYRGTNSNKIELNNIVETTAADTTAEDNPDTYPGYFAFDVFLQNSNKDGEGTPTEVLQLNSDSTLNLLEVGGNPASGLQNTVRVGFALYSGVAEITDSAAQIISKTNAGTSYISDVSIWEPNADAHIENIVKNNNKLILDDDVATDWSTIQKGVYDTFTTTLAVPTYGLDAKAVSSTITNIYDWKATPTASEDAGKVKMQYTVQTPSTGLADPYDLKSTRDGTTDFEIPANKVVKLRIYIWLEGQDVDCTNYASHGGGIDVDIGFIKGETTVGNPAEEP